MAFFEVTEEKVAACRYTSDAGCHVVFCGVGVEAALCKYQLVCPGYDVRPSLKAARAPFAGVFLTW